jgi:adenine phosphoribosyltransferase
MLPASFSIRKHSIVVDDMVKSYSDVELMEYIDESRGFLLGAVSLQKRISTSTGQKKRQAARENHLSKLFLEYGSATLEIHEADLIPGKRWLIIDDLIATGGTLQAVASMIEKAGASVAGIFSIIGLPFLKYHEKIGKYNPKTLINYHSE